MTSKIHKYLILAMLLPWLGACSTGQMVARTSTAIMDGNVDAMNRETDLALAEAAMPASLKLIEGLIQEDPNNTELLTYAAQGFYGYAFGFVELSDRQRAETLYERGASYGKRALRAFGVDIDLAIASVDEIDETVGKLGKRAVPALFWTASNWAKQIDLKRTDPAYIAQLASTERLMHRVLELQADFYYGGAYVYYGVYYGSRAPMLGGNFDHEQLAVGDCIGAGKILLGFVEIPS
ncbi:MAG: TRAP transporter TatT component family protein, partial [Pseudomonadota bacterium]|nr:TRAP transporter TatT component family protein [Pseudomonadota bacterium]